MKILNYNNWKSWTQQLLDWLDAKFAAVVAAVASSIDFTTVNNKVDAVGGKVDSLTTEVTTTHPYAKEAQATQNKQAILDKIGTPASGQANDLFAALRNINIDTTELAKQGNNAAATNTAIYEQIGTTPDPVKATTLFGWLKKNYDILFNINNYYPYAKESTSMQLMRSFYLQNATITSSAFVAGNKGKYVGSDSFATTWNAAFAFYDSNGQYIATRYIRFERNDKALIEPNKPLYYNDGHSNLIQDGYVTSVSIDTNNDILAALGNINFASLQTALQGSDTTATLTAILEALTGGDDPSPDIPEGVAERLAAIMQFFNISGTVPEYTALTSAEAIAIARDCQYNVMGTDWPIPTWLPTGVTEAQVESAAEGLGIPYHEPTQTA